MYLNDKSRNIVEEILRKILVPYSVYHPENVSEYKAQNLLGPNIDNTVDTILRQLTTHSKVTYIINTVVPITENIEMTCNNKMQSM